jgi:hypothetical protein
MKRLLIVTGALAVLALPVSTATAAHPNGADKREAQKECRALRGTTDATREAFKAQFKNFGACVSAKAKEAKAERKAAHTNAAKECREERGETEASRAAFAEKYGTNANNRNAFGKCVSQKAKAKRAEQDKKDAAEAKEFKNAAQECDDERGDTDASRDAFAEKYGKNANDRNAFGKCVSAKVQEDD